MTASASKTVAAGLNDSLAISAGSRGLGAGD